MDEHEILVIVEEGKKEFGVKCGKHTGVLTVEAIKMALQDLGIPVSNRDVYISGIPIEIDLLLLKEDKIVNPKYNMEYDPEDVAAVLEIKNRGSFGLSTINKVKKDFDLIKSKYSEIKCIYITLLEEKNYKNAVTDINIGHPTYTLFLHGGKYTFQTGDWDRLINDLQSMYSNIVVNKQIDLMLKALDY